MTCLDDFEPIGLEQLLHTAALMTRVDRKYAIAAHELRALLAGFDNDTRVLEIDGRRRFGYESVYFDTPDLLSYHLSARPRRLRFKLRTRHYLDSGTAFVELKSRGRRGVTVKERWPHPPELAYTLSRSARIDLSAALAAVGLDEVPVPSLAPTATTRYRRTTLLDPDGLGRTTVDTDLAWLGAGGGFSVPNLVIIETKSATGATTVDRLLWRSGHRPQSISKYAIGLAVLRPELPRNRWVRLIRGPFDPTHRTQLSARIKEESCALAA